jgi:PAS domain S-box-containing protein
VRFLNWQFESFTDVQGRVSAIRGTVQDITHQKRTDLILDAINEICFDLDENFLFTYANRKAFTAWKKTALEVLGHSIWDVFPVYRGTPVEAALTRAAETRTQVLAEVYCPVIQGWIFLNANPSPAGLIVLHFDVTGQVAVRQRLSEQQEQYRVLVENIPDMVTRWDRDLKLLYANSSFELKTGVPNARLLGRTSREMGQSEDIAGPWMEKLNQVFATGQIQSHYNAFPTPAGMIYLYSRIVPERAADGSVPTLLAIARDITDLKEAEAEIIAGKALLQSVFDASANGIYLARAVRNARHEIVDFDFVLTNQGFIDILGKEVTGKRYHTLIPAAKDAGLFDKLKQVVDTGAMLEEERFYSHDGLHHWFHIIAVKMEDGVVVTFGDITPRHQQQEAITRHLRILQQSEELAQLGSWEYDAATATFQGSEGMYRLFGLAPGTPVSPEIYLQYVQQRDRPLAEKIVRQIRDQQPFEETLRVKVGRSCKTFRIKAVVIPGPAGHPAKVLGLDLDITAVSRLEQQNLHMKLHQQKKLMLAILEAQETERTRIAEGLHNGVGQLLYAAKLNLDQLSGEQPAQQDWQAGYYRQVDHLLLEAIAETRRISHELMPGILEDLGLTAAIQDIGLKLSGEHLDLSCRVSLRDRPLPKHLQLAVYRIAQELANNIVKHAAATRASIRIRQKGRYLTLQAEDNGIGFAPKPGQPPGIGLKAIRDRVKLLNGTMEIESRVQQGTLISIYLPVLGAA